jgi:hypothetical protein
VQQPLTAICAQPIQPSALALIFFPQSRQEYLKTWFNSLKQLLLKRLTPILDSSSVNLAHLTLTRGSLKLTVFSFLLFSQFFFGACLSDQISLPAHQHLPALIVLLLLCFCLFLCFTSLSFAWRSTQWILFLLKFFSCLFRFPALS